MTTVPRNHVAPVKEEQMIIKDVETNSFLGFSSGKEIFLTLTGLRNWTMAMLEFIITAFGVFTSFINLYVFSPYQQLYVLMVFLIVDFITGMAVGISVRKEGFSTRKSQRIVLLVISYGFAMSGSYWLSKVGDAYFFMPDLVFYYLSSVVALSSFKNLSLLGLLPKGLTQFLYKYVDTHKDKVSEIIERDKKANQDASNKTAD